MSIEQLFDDISLAFCILALAFIGRVISEIAVYLISSRYWNEDGSTKRCTECGSRNVSDRTCVSIEGIVTEREEICGSCGEHLAYWAYGAYEDDYRSEFIESKMAFAPYYVGLPFVFLLLYLLSE